MKEVTRYGFSPTWVKKCFFPENVITLSRLYVFLCSLSLFFSRSHPSLLPFPSASSNQGWAGVAGAQCGSLWLCGCVCEVWHRRSVGASVSSARIYFVVIFCLTFCRQFLINLNSIVTSQLHTCYFPHFLGWHSHIWDYRNIFFLPYGHSYISYEELMALVKMSCDTFLSSMPVTEKLSHFFVSASARNQWVFSLMLLCGVTSPRKLPYTVPQLIKG